MAIERVSGSEAIAHRPHLAADGRPVLADDGFLGPEVTVVAVVEIQHAGVAGALEALDQAEGGGMTTGSGGGRRHDPADGERGAAGRSDLGHGKPQVLGVGHVAGKERELGAAGVEAPVPGPGQALGHAPRPLRLEHPTALLDALHGRGHAVGHGHTPVRSHRRWATWARTRRPAARAKKCGT